MTDLYVASYAPSQNAWHVETLEEHVRNNAECLAMGTLREADFCAVLLAESQEAAHAAITEAQALLDRKEGERV